MFHLLAISLSLSLGQAQLPEPTRPIDIWNPFGTTTTQRPQGKGISENEVIVRLPIGDIVGRKIRLSDLPWTPDQDPLEQIPQNRERLEPNPLPKNNSVTVFTFLGVPYAEPPTGERRFKPPQQLIHFPGTNPYLAFTWGASCAQEVETHASFTREDWYPFLVNEDCLYLNIFTPDVSKSSGRNYPVVVFLHGGNFQTGSANEWPGHGLASRGVVVVTVNYRLGAFGFLSLGDTNSGNFGLLDQRMALEWVRDHISSFGGDPQAITLVGHDAGGVSVGLHMLSPLSKHLFRSASSMSGSEVSYHSLIGKPALAFNNTLKLGRYLGCTQALPGNVWDCIKTRSMDDIIRATTSIPIEYNRYLFMPTIDGVNIPANPLWLLNNIPTGGASYPSPVPYLTGMNAQDGTEVILEDRYLGEFNQFNNVDEEYMKSFALEYAFRHNYTMNKEAIAEAIISRYTFWPDRANEWMKREKFIELATDCYYTAPVSLSAHLHSQAGSRTFFYVNNYNFSRDNDALRFIPNWMAVCRECDLYLLFTYSFLPPDLRPQLLKNATFTSTDRNASQLFSTIYRRFAYHQNPNMLYDGSWPPFEPRGHWYMNFNYSIYDEMRVPGKVGRDYRYDDVAFWNEYIPQLVNYMTTTFPPEEVSVRRELMVFQWIVGILALVLIIFIVCAGAMAYQVFEGRQFEENEMHKLVNIQSDLPSQASTYSRPRYREAAERMSVL
ncbi:hypothetical protein PFISCL1PPCAC_24757 [Pristionchus fissidentatus]|uniref:Carboxylesterase type B domain-containing protein n=1 Tax=Pristionchus fissidentatus TaxID=1538716 RepID=A0AAV5WS68_9BILA|nr:hypothetical protein PFISCL1PPCAC_24757 [Pristionchus fissidentatus]